MRVRTCQICGEPLDCVECAGVGTITRTAIVRCPQCEGDGDVYADDFTRRVTCPECNAEGVVSRRQTETCWECNGTRICARCRKDA
jgi:DnaJ-class molecular chaperone